jgi:putative transposase
MLRIMASDQAEQDGLRGDLDALVREGARRMLVAALRAEVDEYVAQHADRRDAAGHALVVRNGVAEPRTVTTAAGELEIRAPRVHDRREGHRFTSAILPPWARRSPKVTEVLPVLYLRGLSTKDFEPALAEFFGSEAGLSASTIQRLTREWSAEWAAFQQRDLSQVDYVYLWADGVHFSIRLEQDRLCCLVLVGVRADGHKEAAAQPCEQLHGWEIEPLQGRRPTSRPGAASPRPPPPDRWRGQDQAGRGERGQDDGEPHPPH